MAAVAKAIYFKHQLLSLDYPVSMTPRYGDAGHPGLYRLIAAHKDSYRNLLQSFLVYRDKLIATTGVQWVNGFLPALDSIALYCLLAQRNPRRYLEVGCGNSTLFARSSIRDNHLQTRITSIDPNPRRSIESAADEIIRQPVESLPLDKFRELEPGDILFIDNSHRCFPNSDVTVFFLDILPALAPGVLIHLHDICLPWDYTPDFAAHAYSEQYPLATAMLLGGRITTILPNKFVERTPELVEILDPIVLSLDKVEREGCSYWFTSGAEPLTGAHCLP